MALTREAICRLLVELERNFDVNALVCRGYCIWPLMRAHIYFALGTKGAGRPTLKNGEMPASAMGVRIPAAEQLATYESSDNRVARVRGQKPLDVLMLSRPEDYTDQVGGKAYNRLIDPLVQLGWEQNLSSAKVEVQSPLTRELGDRLMPPVYLRLSHKHGIKPVDKAELLNVPDLREVLARKVGMKINLERVAREVHHLLIFTRLFQSVLAKSKPKAIFVVCYYQTYVMGLVLAAKRSGIPCYDVQHGQQGRFHPLYNHFTVAPSSGYACVPDGFWSWGKRSAENINKGFPPQRDRPIAYVGGNPWTALWLRQTNGIIYDSDLQAWVDRKAENGRPKVLVALQPERDIIPKAYLEAMRARPEWDWLVRLHPHVRSRQQEVKDLLADTGAHYDIDDATMAPLYAALLVAQHVLTPFSSVAFEAQAVGRSVTVTDRRARELYAEWISQKTFLYAETPDQIVASIENGGQATTEPAEPYIETSLDVSKRLIRWFGDAEAHVE